MVHFLRIGLSIYNIGVAADLSSAYRNVSLDHASTLVCLFIWVEKPLDMRDSKPVILAQPTASIGDAHKGLHLPSHHPKLSGRGLQDGGGAYHHQML